MIPCGKKTSNIVLNKAPNNSHICAYSPHRFVLIRDQLIDCDKGLTRNDGLVQCVLFPISLLLGFKAKIVAKMIQFLKEFQKSILNFQYALSCGNMVISFNIIHNEILSLKRLKMLKLVIKFIYIMYLYLSHFLLTTFLRDADFLASSNPQNYKQIRTKKSFCNSKLKCNKSQTFISAFFSLFKNVCICISLNLCRYCMLTLSMAHRCSARMHAEAFHHENFSTTSSI